MLDRIGVGAPRGRSRQIYRPGSRTYLHPFQSTAPHAEYKRRPRTLQLVYT